MIEVPHALASRLINMSSIKACNIAANKLNTITEAFTPVVSPKYVDLINI
jgi:hypothetical protein